MLTRRKWLLLGLFAVALVAGYVFVGFGEEARIVDVMRELLHAAELKPGEAANARKARIAASFAEHLEPDVRLDIPELPQPARGRAAVEALALALAQSYTSVRFKIEQTEIRRSTDGADVSSSITLFAADRESELRDTRQVMLAFTGSGGGLRVAAVSVGPRSREEPEARP